MKLSIVWTPALVAAHLVQAFERLPGQPAMSRGMSCAIEALAWPGLYVADPWDRRVLMTWARCRAKGDSVRELYAGLGWPRAKAERHRRQALRAIALGLNRNACRDPFKIGA